MNCVEPCIFYCIYCHTVALLTSISLLWMPVATGNLIINILQNIFCLQHNHGKCLRKLCAWVTGKSCIAPALVVSSTPPCSRKWTEMRSLNEAVRFESSRDAPWIFRRSWLHFYYLLDSEYSPLLNNNFSGRSNRLNWSVPHAEAHCNVFICATVMRAEHARFWEIACGFM